MHIIVVGCGRFGSNLANELSDLGHNLCIIDRSKEKLSVLGSGFNGQKIIGIEFDNDKLLQGGIEQADALLAVTSNDNINITVSLIANKIFHVPQVIARIDDPSRKHVYEILNIDTINPVRLSVDLFLSRMTVNTSEIISHLDNDYQIIDLLFCKKNSTMIVGEIEKKYFCRISIVNIGGISRLPKQDDQIHFGDRITCTINKYEKEKLLKAFSKELNVWNP
ncbi:MAG: TrkA family potassium uptake protein [Clostridia bacterium]